jgi:hypothetical protein
MLRLKSTHVVRRGAQIKDPVKHVALKIDARRSTWGVGQGQTFPETVNQGTVKGRSTLHVHK